MSSSPWVIPREPGDPIGFSSEVHTSLLEPILLFKQVPLIPGIANIVITLLLTVSVMWAFLFMGVFIHLALRALTYGDHQRIEIVARSFLDGGYVGTL